MGSVVLTRALRQSVIYLYPESVFEYLGEVRKTGLTVLDLDETFFAQTEFRIDDPDRQPPLDRPTDHAQSLNGCHC